MSISNLPIPFQMDRDGHNFHAFFQYMSYTRIQIARLSSHSLIRHCLSDMASDAKACFSTKAENHTVIRYLYLKGNTDRKYKPS